MSSKLNQTAWRGVRKLLWIQCGLTFSVAIISCVLSGWLAFYSALLAGACCLFSTVIFAVIFFWKGGAQAARQIARLFYRAEAVKLILTVSLMMMIFAFVPIVAGPFFAAFFVVQTAYWLSLGLFRV